LFFQKK